MEVVQDGNLVAEHLQVIQWSPKSATTAKRATPNLPIENCTTSPFEL